MATDPEVKAVQDDQDVPKVENRIAVGEDLEFQRRWWRFEKITWSFFVLVLVADLSGVLGRGPLANADAMTSDGTLRVKYERVLRENTSSIMTLLPTDRAVHNGQLRLYVSDSVVKQLGAQRVIPQPIVSTVGDGGVVYTFPATSLPMTIQIELKPSFIGRHPYTVGIAGGSSVSLKSLVLP